MGSLPLISTPKIQVSVQAGESKVVHTSPLSDFVSLSYFFNIHNNGLLKSRSFNLNVNKSNTGLSDSVSNIIGSVINYRLEVLVNGLNAEIVLHNDEPTDLDLVFRYSKI